MRLSIYIIKIVGLFTSRLFEQKFKEQEWEVRSGVSVRSCGASASRKVCACETHSPDGWRLTRATHLR